MDSLDDPHSLFLLASSFLDIFSSSMDPIKMSVQFLVMILGLAFSAIFSGSEVAFFSLNHEVSVLKQKEHSADKLIIKMLDAPRRLLATILIGNTFSNIIASVLATAIMVDIAEQFGFSELIVGTIEVVLLTFLILILSEITPKIISINNPLRVSRRYAGFIHFLYVILGPFATLIAKSTINLEKYLPKPTSKMTSEDIITMAEVSEQEGSIHEGEREIIENVIEFGNTTVKEIMTSRVNMDAVSCAHTLPQVIEMIREKGYSRMPLYENDMDTIVGIIYAKDVLKYLDEEMNNSSFDWPSIAKKTLYVPSKKKVDDLLRDFQSEKMHMAIVVDEYGGTEGLVTMDDILEEIIGDFSDESDEGEQKPYKQFKNGTYIFDAQIDLDDMEEVLGLELTADDDEFETLGGLVYHLTERLPDVGERVNYIGLELTVHSVENNRIKKIRVKPEEKA